jgi:leucyl aminopeptidase
MEFSVKSGDPEKQRSSCVVVGIHESRRLSTAAQELDRASEGHLSSVLRRGDMEGRVGQTLLLHNVPNSLCERVMLVGCGRERDLDDRAYRKILASAINGLQETGASDAVVFLSDLHVKGRDLAWRIRDAVRTTGETVYRFDTYKSKSDNSKRTLRKITLSVPSRRDLPAGERAIEEGSALVKGMNYTKDLGNQPPNICTPTYLAEKAATLAEAYSSISTEVLARADMEKLGMGAFLAVARGSRQAPQLIVMHYKGGDEQQKPVALVGKGITFDTGGISLKPGANMDEMKYDMCGAASVFGTLVACAELNLPLNVLGVVPTCENMPGGDATRPGDIVTTMSGQTVEILNTDAEGRLILCDALTYTERFEPEAVVDIATLTGACIIALGHHASGLLSNHNPLAHDLLNAGKIAGDRAWELPLWDEYQDSLKSPFADMANIGGKSAGTITAACFLSRFTKKFNWAHLDIAGTAWNSGDNKGATGRPVPLLLQYLIERSIEAKK